MLSDDGDNAERIEAARAFLMRSFLKACAEHRLNRREANVVMRAVLGDGLAALTQYFPLPVAPELWSDRTGRKENPIAFIRRVYAGHVGSGLTRADLRRIDAPLYAALHVWEGRHPETILDEIPRRRQTKRGHTLRR